MRNELGKFTTPRRWHEITLMCYRRGCVCNGCKEYEFLSDGVKCQVKAAVLESVRVLGAPFERYGVVMDK